MDWEPACEALSSDTQYGMSRKRQSGTMMIENASRKRYKSSAISPQTKEAFQMSIKIAVETVLIQNQFRDVRDNEAQARSLIEEAIKKVHFMNYFHEC